MASKHFESIHTTIQCLLVSQEREAAKPKQEFTEETEEEVVHDENEWSTFCFSVFIRHAFD